MAKCRPTAEHWLAMHEQCIRHKCLLDKLKTCKDFCLGRHVLNGFFEHWTASWTRHDGPGSESTLASCAAFFRLAVPRKEMTKLPGPHASRHLVPVTASRRRCRCWQPYNCMPVISDRCKSVLPCTSSHSFQACLSIAGLFFGTSRQ